MDKRKILIVDDETTITSYLHKKLTKLGYAVTIAEDGEEALDRAFEDIPDIVLLDVKLPKLTGYEVCAKLKADERTNHVPVVILSAKAQSDEIARGLAAGAEKYLCKPIGFPDILKELKALEGPREESR